ncbi:hypothetical protein M0R45_037736 [Rubus argutus]|uniref:Uncharacterized protein n=1 Tax=Rubus argutus TaxID=59490 RepID=A0AAW1W0X3_RUBAR
MATHLRRGGGDPALERTAVLGRGTGRVGRRHVGGEKTEMARRAEREIEAGDAGEIAAIEHRSVIWTEEAGKAAAWWGQMSWVRLGSVLENPVKR